MADSGSDSDHAPRSHRPALERIVEAGGPSARKGSTDDEILTALYELAADSDKEENLEATRLAIRRENE